MSISLIEKYFPKAEGHQMDRLGKLEKLYAEWNAQINLISRNDFEHFWERHVLHSLALALYFKFPEGARVIDVGTGGGFPGIPLSIWFPDTEFVLNDSIRKKLKVAEDVAARLQLKNVKTSWCRSEEIKEQFDYITGRAVKSIPEFYGFTEHLLKPDKHAAYWYWKGGEFEEELASVPMHTTVYKLHEMLAEPFFETKCLIKMQR